MIIFIGIYALLNYFYYGIIQARTGRKPDFDPYYTAAYCLQQGLNPYNTQTLLKASVLLGAQKTANSINRCVYPPLYMQALRPLIFFNIQTARLIWSLLSALFI